MLRGGRKEAGAKVCGESALQESHAAVALQVKIAKTDGVASFLKLRPRKKCTAVAGSTFAQIGGEGERERERVRERRVKKSEIEIDTGRS